MFRHRFFRFALIASGIAAESWAEDVSGLLEPIRERRAVPGLAAAAFYRGELVAIGATGARKHGASEVVTINDKWHVGSCTKSMTASLAAILVQQGKLKWDTTVAEVFLEMRQKIREQWRAVTLEQLLNHRAGAPGEAPADLWKRARQARGKPLEQRLDFVKGLLAREPEAMPGTKSIYSNQGYAIAGAMLERRAGRPWEELITAQLFTPLGMKSTGFGAPGSASRIDQPWGHRTREGTIEPEPPGPSADNPAAIGPAGTVHCSIGDFARYAAWHARRAPGTPPLLNESSFARLHQPPAGEDYAMGWIAAKRDWAGGVTLTHNGSNTMWYAVMWVAPEKDAAFVAATNIAGKDGDKACDDAVALLIGRVLKK